MRAVCVHSASLHSCTPINDSTLPVFSSFSGVALLFFAVTHGALHHFTMPGLLLGNFRYSAVPKLNSSVSSQKIATSLTLTLATTSRQTLHSKTAHLSKKLQTLFSPYSLRSSLPPHSFSKYTNQIPKSNIACMIFQSPNLESTQASTYF